MAATKTTKNDLSALLGIEVEVGEADEANAHEIRSSRGRQEGKDVIALRNLLRESMESGKAKVFEGITNEDDKATLVRKVRQAGKGAGPNGEDVKVATSFNRSTNKLFWGPKAVIDQIVGRTNQKSE